MGSEAGCGWMGGGMIFLDGGDWLVDWLIWIDFD